MVERRVDKEVCRPSSDNYTELTMRPDVVAQGTCHAFHSQDCNSVGQTTAV